MFLKSALVKNFRKFGEQDNVVRFVDFQQKEDDINIATSTTLVVGKNNVGKTTITRALDKLINKKTLTSNDFNYNYLKSIVKGHQSGSFAVLPHIEFEIKIGLENKEEMYVTNIAQFMILGDQDEVTITIRYELEDEEIYKEDMKQLMSKYKKNIPFSKILDLISPSNYKLNYYDRNMKKVNSFYLSDLMELVTIEANNIDGEKSLSNAFNKIIRYRFNSGTKENKAQLGQKLEVLSKDLTKNIQSNHVKNINSPLKSMGVGTEVSLSAEITEDNILRSLIKYEYKENGNFIPENQYGLGYTNLVMTIASLIEYMEKYPDTSFNSKINLICIEEPETHMHPQMQELFIKYINDAIRELLSHKENRINSQLLITTHSAHILNSKIHEGGNFNNISYVTSVQGISKVVNLRDEVIKPDNDPDETQFKFIKKHIKFKTSELFFADAVILVEGISEYNLLPFYIDNDEELTSYYITVLNVNGAHSLVYKKLLNLLGVPVLIITDLDIKRTSSEKEIFMQITNSNLKQMKKVDGVSKERTTTNATLKGFNGDNDSIVDLVGKKFIKDKNIYVAYQQSSLKYYPTSFEEAFILRNFNDNLLNSMLKDMHPKIYNDIAENPINFDNNKNKSYKWQRKLSGSKSEFSNNLLFELLTSDKKFSELPKLPNYIEEGLKALKKELKGK